MTPGLLRVALFLDIDGVLHRGLTGTLDKLPLLEAFLRRHPSVVVVVSSSWRMTHSEEELRSLFSSDLQGRVVGVTPFLPEGAAFRQREIEAWLSEHPGLPGIALDDERSLYEPGCDWVLLTDPTTGLTAQDIARLDAVLGDVR